MKKQVLRDTTITSLFAAALKVIAHLVAKFYNFNRVAFYHAACTSKIKSTETF